MRTTAGAPRVGVLARLRRPDSPLERTRWLFLLLVAGSVVVLIPQTLTSSAPAVAFLACAVLLASSCRGYLTGRATWPADVVDVIAIAAYTMAAHKPDQALSLSFSAVWLRAAYGSRGRSLARCGLYEVAMTVGLICWPLIPGNTGNSEAATLLAVYPVLAVTVTIVGVMMSNFVRLAESARRDAVLADLGSALLAEADAKRVYTLAWAAAEQLCDATPGLRMLIAIEKDGVGVVRGTRGSFDTVPTILDVGRLVGLANGESVTDDTTMLGVAGPRCRWVCLPLEHFNGRGWMVAGGPATALNGALNSLRSVVSQVELALRSADARDLLVERASTDPLTGLANRAAFADRASRVLAHPSAGGTALLFIDLDHFKLVNDGLGHAAGDEVLQCMAERLLATARGTDCCARLGGDEFAVLLTGASVDAARRAAERLIEAICQPVVVAGHETSVAASIGVAHSPGGPTSYGELVGQADAAMYAAKAQGKRRVHVYGMGGELSWPASAAATRVGSARRVGSAT